MKFDSASRPKGPKDKFFSPAFFKFLLEPDFIRSVADSAGLAVKIFGGWLNGKLTKNSLVARPSQGSFTKPYFKLSNFFDNFDLHMCDKLIYNTRSSKE